MITKCSICDKIMNVKPFRIKRLKNGITCSKTCSYKLKESAYMGRNNPNTKFTNLNDNIFDNINSVEKAYLLGWIASDGSINKNNSITIAIHNKDKDCLFNLKELICSDLEIKIKNDSMIYFTINSKKIVNNICEYLNISPGSKHNKIELPKFKNKKLTWAFLRGFFDGDGSIPKSTHIHKTRCSITSNSKKMLSQIEDFCKIKCYNNKKDKLEFYGINAIKFMKNVYENSNEKTRLKRKYDSFLDRLENF